MASPPQPDINIISLDRRIHWFAISYDYLPKFTRIQSTLDQVRTYKWWPPSVFNPLQGATINLFLNRLDKFLHECEVSRQQKETWERFKSDKCKMRQEFVSRGDEEIFLTLAQLAQDRAHIINYVLAHRISPVIHQMILDVNPHIEDTEINADIHYCVRHVIEDFWGDKQGQNPLPQRWVEDAPSISNYHGWADRIDDKLTAMATGSWEGAEILQDLFWWDGIPQPSRRPKLCDREGSDNASGVTGTSDADTSDTDDIRDRVLHVPEQDTRSVRGELISFFRSQRRRRRRRSMTGAHYGE